MTGSSIQLCAAGLLGAASIALWAFSAHHANGQQLETAALMALFHALAVMAMTALRKSNLVNGMLGRLATAGWLLGAVLFSADLSARAYLGTRLFPMAAPLGGMVLIASWILAAIAALRPASAETPSSRHGS